MSLEVERAKYLKRAMVSRGIVPDDFLEEGYSAIGIHSNSTIIACNQALADMTGYSVDELEGMNAWRLFAPESANLLMQNLKTMSEAPYQVTAIRKDGVKYEVELKGINFELSGDMARAVMIKAL
ncbi:MAG: PAS domain-containing protein [Gammaproteobacteria bacterium]